MSAIQTIRDVIVAAATSVGDRVSPLRTFQGGTFPYVTLNETNTQPQNALDGFADLDLCEVQADFWDATYLGADAAARAGRAAVEAAGYICISRITDFFDGQLDPGAFRVGIVFQVWQ